MKSVGLTAEPTIHSLKLGPDTKSIILASDGVRQTNINAKTHKHKLKEQT